MFFVWMVTLHRKILFKEEDSTDYKKVRNKECLLRNIDLKVLWRTKNKNSVINLN